MFQTNVAEEIKTEFLFNNIFVEERAVCEMVWENVVEPDRP
jgi:hypothetical protein